MQAVDLVDFLVSELFSLQTICTGRICSTGQGREHNIDSVFKDSSHQDSYIFDTLLIS